MNKDILNKIETLLNKYQPSKTPFANQCTEGMSKGVLKDLQEIKQQLQEEEQEDKWISVKDRLPEDRKLVLLNSNGIRFVGFYLYGNKHECEHQDDCNCIYNEAEDMYLMEAGFREQVANWPEYAWLEIFENEPTHWQPLEEPPRNIKRS